MAKGQQSYDERVKARARRWYELDGWRPSRIQQLLRDVDRVDVPIDTVKYWVRGLDRGVALREGEPWDFDAATPEERRLAAPLFNVSIRSLAAGITEPVENWPLQDVADWLVRLRQIAPKADADLALYPARYLAALDRRIGTDDERESDKAHRRNEIADWMAMAASFEHKDVMVRVPSIPSADEPATTEDSSEPESVAVVSEGGDR